MKMNKCLKYSSIILLLIGLFFFSYNSQLAYAEDNNYNVISNDEINGDLEGLYDYISTMKSDFELINDLECAYELSIGTQYLI